jgi:hypothetical protein
MFEASQRKRKLLGNSPETPMKLGQNRPLSDRKLNEINAKDGIARALQPQPDIYLLDGERGGAARKKLVEEGRGSTTHERLMVAGLKRGEPC